MISLWWHIPVVLTLLGLHGTTAYIAMRRIKDLRGALEAKTILLGDNIASSGGHPYSLVAGDTLTLDFNGQRPAIGIKALQTTRLEVIQ